LTEQKLTLSDVTPELLQKVAQDSSGLSLKVSREDIHESTDPLKLVETYTVRGGPSPTEVKRMLAVRKRWTALSMSNLSKKKLKLNEAEDMLQSVVESYSSSENSSIAKLKS
jgi:argininosuccinate lyase